MNDKLKFKNLNSSPVNIGDGNTVTQYFNNDLKELNNIINSIMKDISSLEKEDAEGIIDVVDMVREELAKQKPKESRLKNCLALITPMLTIANGVPTLVDNLQRLVDYITLYRL